MRIGVNALYLLPGGVGGTEIYLRRLLDALGAIDRVNEYVLFTNAETGVALGPVQPNFRVRRLPVAATSRPRRIFYEQFGLPRRVREERIDVLLNPGFTAPWHVPCPQVTVFHDLQHVRHPEHFRWWDLPFWRVLLWAAARRSAEVIAVSEATRADVWQHYRLPPERVTTVRHGVEQEFFALPRTPDHTRPFLLTVSTLHPHKNLTRLVRAFARLDGPYRLVLAGMHGFHTRALQREIAESGAEDRVRLTGWIPRSELYDLFRRADAFVYPSTFEGFGMPVLEAMAAGLPTLCADIAPLREVAGDAALFFAVRDEDELLAGLERITRDEELRAVLARRGPEHAREFTWERAARETLAVLKSCWVKE